LLGFVVALLAGAAIFAVGTALVRSSERNTDWARDLVGADANAAERLDIVERLAVVGEPWSDRAVRMAAADDPDANVRRLARASVRVDIQAVPPPAEPAASGSPKSDPRLRDAYLDLVRDSLLDRIYDPEGADYLVADRDWPLRAHSMIGLERMDNIRTCVETVLAEGVPGDLMETGVWRGGATIFMRALLEAYGDRSRKVWVADSFRGLPPPDPEQFPVDAGDAHHERDELAISLATVRENFRRYGLLDDRVVFVEGWFRDTLPACGVERLAVLRLDGDLYESTYVALESLYPKLSIGGFAIVDDYALPACRQAIHDFRAAQNIDEPLVTVDWTGTYWRRRA